MERSQAAPSETAQYDILGKLIAALPSMRNSHAPGNPVFEFLKETAQKEVCQRFSGTDTSPRPFEPFGELSLPYVSMGAINSLNLFDINELILFSFYWANRKRYKRVLDIGANIGLHSIIMSRCGFEVRAYEPDPIHLQTLQDNLQLNRCTNVTSYCAAISNRSGNAEFTRVLGNTTGSHLTGSKPDPYGPLETFSVKLEPFNEIIDWADLIKLDIEGHEKVVLASTDAKHWRHRDGLVEVHSPENASALYNHLKNIGLNLFSQKTNWRLVRNLDDMPMSYHEGKLFVTCSSVMPWD
jgi:FkbM family methyltransferase